MLLITYSHHYTFYILCLVHFCPTWDYFRLCFSFSCSGYDLTLIKKSHVLNNYLFLQKYNLTNLLLVTVIAQFTDKITNSEKATYFLSLMSGSRNTLKSHMFFTFKYFMFSDFMWKNILLQEMVGGGQGAAIPLSLWPCTSIAQK